MNETHKAAQIALSLLQRAPGGELGVTKLWGLLFYADLAHTEQFGRPMSGLVYRKGRHGPIPEQGAEVLERLARQGSVSLRSIRRFHHRQVLCRGMKLPDMREFDFSERAILEEVALEWMRATAYQLESAIRQSEPWRRTRYGSRIPLEQATAHIV